MESWDDLKYALMVHRHGGLSGAARALNVNHSTVSRRLSALENHMGVRLFDRLPSGLKATEHGERCVEAARHIEQHVLDLNLSIAAKDEILAGPLKVSAPQLIVQYHLADIARLFKNAYPQIELSLIATSDAVNLHRREADVSVRAVKEPEDTLWGRRVITQNCTYFGAISLLADNRETDTLPCLNFMWHGDEVADKVLKHYPQSRVVAKFDDMVGMVGAVESGMGIARMPCFIGDRNTNLARVPLIDPEPYFDIWVLTHPDLKDVARIKTFMRFCARELKKREPLFKGTMA